jgi:sulfonate transport system substrate-binding protein
MLTREENELLTRTGPGTPMGMLMRRYWVPALFSDRLAEPDGAPLRVKLLGERLVAFRDTKGRVDRKVQNRDSDYLIDRALQKSGHYTGIRGLGTQDCGIQESMGPIADRTGENLGVGDTAIAKIRPRKRRNSMRALAAIAAAVALLATPAAADPVKIRVSWVAIVSNMPSILFLKPGLARHEGKSYVFEAAHYSSTPLMIPALATGDLDIATFAYSSLGAAIVKAGLDDVRVIADELQDGVEGYYSDEYMVRKDSPIRTVEDLKGKILASSGIGGAMDVPMRGMLKKHGLDPLKDVTIVEVGMPNHRAALADGKVDLISSPLPFSQDPNLRAMARTLFTQHEAAGTTQMIMWSARAGWLAKNRAAVVDFLEDTIRARRWYADPANHDEAVKLVTTLTKEPAEHYKSWLFTKADYFRDPNDEPNLGALQQNLDTLAETNLLPAKIDIAAHADLSLVKEAAARLK